MSLSNNFPTILPTLLLDFANVGRLDPRVTFTRASTARYYDGVTTAVAEQNLLLQSQTFDVAANWAATNVTVSADTAETTAPDGTATAEKLTITGGSAAHAVAQSLALAVATYIVSVFVKKGTQFYFRFGRNTGASIPAPGTWWWDVDAGTFNGTLGSGWTNQSITNVGNGWYRCSVSVTTTAAGTDGFSIALTNNAGNNIFSADNNTFYIWGAQLEQRSAVTAYTATTTQPITNYVPVLLTAQNNVPRFDHNPTTGVALGLEIEEQRTNLLTYSEDFANAAWTKTNSSITSNTIVAPDGTLTGDALVENTANAEHYVRENLTGLAANTTHTVSCYAKANGRNTRIRVLDTDNINNGYVGVFDLSAGTATASNIGSGTGASVTITAVGNGWYRCAVSGNAGASCTKYTIDFYALSGATIIYTGDGYSGIFIWGAQLEAGAFATSYIPTTTTALTRNADVASMTGTNFSSWYNQSAGTFLTLFSLARPSSGSNQFTVRASDNGYNNAVGINTISTGFASIATVSGGVFDGLATAVTPLTANVAVRFIGCYATNDLAVSLNGAAVVTDTSATIPTGMTRLDIGSDHAGFNRFQSGYIQRISYYPVRLPNSTLQALTA